MKKNLLILFVILFTVTKLHAQFTPTIALVPDSMRVLPPDFGGYNSSNIIQEGETLADTCLKMAIPMTDAADLRYPPGATGLWWNFQKGGFEDPAYLPVGWTQPPRYATAPNTNKLLDYKNTTDSTVCSLLYNINLLTSDKNFQRASIFAAKGLNLKVSGIELGNELYFGLQKRPEFTYRFPTAAVYADSCNAWAALLKASFPAIEIAAVGAVDDTGDEARIVLWNDYVLPLLSSNIKNIVYHKYSGSNLTGTDGNNKPIPTNIDTTTNEELKPMFRRGFKAADAVDGLIAKAANFNKKVWITEYNLYDDFNVVHGSWAHGLFLAATTYGFIVNPIVTKLDCHTVFGTGVFGAIFSNTDGFDYGGEFKSPTIIRHTKACELTAAGNALSLFMPSIRNSTNATPIRFNGDMPVSLGQGGYKSVAGIKFTKPTGAEAIVMNFSESTLNIEPYSIFGALAGTYEMIWGTPQTFIIGNAIAAAPTDSTLQKITGTFTGVDNATIVQKPYSIIRLITVNDVKIISSVDTVCSGTFATLKAYGKGPFTWTSTQPGFTPPVPTNSVIHVQTALVGLYNYTATSSTGNDTKSIRFLAAPTLQIQRSGISESDITVCAGTTVSLTAVIGGSSPNKKYAWTRSEDINNPSAQTVIITPKKSINKYILYATDGYCWNVTDTIIIRVKGMADAGNDTTICITSPATPVTLQAQQLFTGNNYEWVRYLYSPILSTTATYNVTTPLAGAITYRLKVTNAGCINPSYDYIVVNNNNCCIATGVQSMQPYSNINQFVANGSPISAALDASNSDPFNNLDTLSNYSGNIYFNGPFDVNQNFTFINCPNLKFSQNALVTVGNFDKLNLVNSTLGVCTSAMWTGIKTPTPLTKIEITGGTNIKDAIIGLETQQNAVIEVRNSSFVDNRFHLKIFDYTISYQDSIYGNNFYVTHPLYESGGKEITLAAITVEKSTNFGIGNVNKNPNTINGVLLYGIDAINAGVTVINNDFLNMSYKTLPPYLSTVVLYPAPNQGNAGVHVVNSGAIARYVTIGGVNAAYENTFDACPYNGVYSEGKVRLLVQRNVFTNFNKGTKIYNPSFSFDIVYNNFSSNYYINTTDPATNKESTAIDASSATQVNLKSYISNNTISNSRVGGYFSNINSIIAIDNNISISKPSSGTQSKHFGFNLLTCSGAIIERNYIATSSTSFGLLTTAQRQDYKAINIDNVSNSFIRDNDLSRFGNHVYVKGDCTGSNISCNRFYRGGNSGIYSTELLQTIKLEAAKLADFGTISASANNLWDADYSTVVTPANYRIVGSLATFFQAKYNILNADPTTKKPNPYSVSGLLNQFATASNGCNPGVPMITADQGDNNDINTVDLSKDNELSDTTIIVNSVLDYQPIYDSTNTASGYFSDLAIYNLGQILIDSGYVDSSAVAATFEGTDIESIMALNEALMHSDSAMAITLCNELEGTDIVMQNIKTMNTFLVKPENYVYTNTDSTTIKSIAYQKVRTAGPGVVTARNWLGIYLTDSESLSIPKSSINDGFENNWQVKLYPNPSKGLLKIESSTFENLTLTISDMLGNWIATESNMVTGNILDYKNLTNGVYLISITDENQNKKNFRWTIQK